jgi:hypothetical protein
MEEGDVFKISLVAGITPDTHEQNCLDALVLQFIGGTTVRSRGTYAAWSLYRTGRGRRLADE